MRIIFFEVRSKTETFLKIANELKNINFKIDIHWVVQNKAFFYKNIKNVHYLNLPSKKDINMDFDDIDYRVKLSDRFMIHFNQNAWYYKDYRNQIERLMMDLKPDCIFGEVGNFFTHYACLIAKQKRIPFFDIESSRYPVGSISFCQYDQWDPIKLRDVSHDEIHIFIKNFLKERPVPDYMNKNKTWRQKLENIKYRAKVLYGYMLGDRFATQNPINNFVARMQVKRQMIRWDDNSISINELTSKNNKILLYPLQLQPELNLEVWGQRYNNQYSLIKKLSESIPEDWVLVLKANPKNYFELNTLNIDILRSIKNIFFLERTVSMREIDKKSSVVVTVTGSVQIERIIMNKPVYILGNTPFLKYSCIQEDIDNIKDWDEAKNFLLTEKQISEVVRYLLEHSVEGMMSEPASNINCLSPNNVKLIASTIEKILVKIKKYES